MTNSASTLSDLPGADALADSSLRDGSGGGPTIEYRSVSAGQLSDFAEPGSLDLRDVAFGPSNILAYFETPTTQAPAPIVQDAMPSANVLLLGQYMTALSGALDHSAGAITTPTYILRGGGTYTDLAPGVTPPFGSPSR